MKKLLLACLLFTGWSQAQNITFTDLNLKNELTNSSSIYDKNHDGEIDMTEANTITSMNISANYSSFSFVDFSNFPNLVDLYLYTYTPDVIDFTGLNKIKTFEIWSLPNVSNIILDQNKLQNLSEFTINEPSKLETINTQELVSLKVLHIGTTFFSDFPFEYWNNVQNFRASLLKNIDLTKNIYLENLLLYSDNLTELDLSKNLNLKILNLYKTNITTIDVSMIKELGGITTPANLKSIDLSNNFKLDSIVLSVGVENANLKNGTSSWRLRLEPPKTHLYICADNQNIPLIQQTIKNSDLSNIEVNSYCTFTPGGLYNTITSNVKYDLTGNCTGNDNFTLFTKFSIEDKNGKGTSVTNKQGVVNFYKQAGTYTLTPQLENPTYFQISPSLPNFNLMDNSGHDTTINFCITPKGIYNDLEIVLSPIGRARPGFDSKYQVTYKNKGNQTLSGDFKVEYNDDVLDLVASSLTSTSTGKLGKSFADLKPFEVVSTDTIVFKVNSPTATPAVNQGDTLKFIASINPIQGDETPEDNVFKFNQIVVNSLDPNLITCIEGNVLPSKEIGKTVHYLIEFENTGNYPAENIVVVETIDPKKFDINSIQILNTSHPMKLRMEGNKVEYYFQNIDLGEHKHGNILLKLRALSNLIEGDTVNKQANIYFDYNAPVETNKETTVYKDQLLASIKGITLDESIIAYPNPNNGVFTLKAANQISSVEIYDLHGRSIQTIIVNDFTNKIDLSNQDAGIYLVKVTTSTGANVLEIKKD